MAADGLTLDGLCAAVRHFLTKAATDGTVTGEQRELVLCGVPGDDVMRAALELFGGSFKITVRELPAEVVTAAAVGVEDVDGGNGGHPFLWRPGQD